MLLQGVSTSNQKEDKNNSKQFPKKKPKAKKVANLTLDQQLTCFAEIIVEQLIKESNCL
jgi:hypothetical protein